MKKIVGWVLAIAGLVGVAAYTIPEVKSAIPYLQVIDDLMLIIISLALVLIGLLMAMKGRSSRMKKGAEVPIYHGKEIVGYRRH